MDLPSRSRIMGTTVWNRRMPHHPGLFTSAAASSCCSTAGFRKSHSLRVEYDVLRSRWENSFKSPCIFQMVQFTWSNSFKRAALLSEGKSSVPVLQIKNALKPLAVAVQTTKLEAFLTTRMAVVRG
eukprot:m.315460 g.315460  ORF g.315460 m.315460 type:complete len:126 (+) comp23068_c0_seq20:632-1009(+)